ncbi:27584_t:CDS:1, partial [Gigaspora margarita]
HKFAEAKAQSQQGKANKNQDNQEFSDGLLREKKANLNEGEVKSNLENSFINLAT